MITHPIARNHPLLHYAPFCRPIAKGHRRTGLVRVYPTEYGTLTVTMLYELDIADQDLLFCILALAKNQNKGMFIQIEEKNKKLLDKLSMSFVNKEVDIDNLPAMRLSVSRYELLKEMQRSNGKSNYQWLADSMKRLAKISFDYEGEKWDGSFHLMSMILNKNTGMYDIIINPISTHSICYNSMGYKNIDRRDRHKLTKDESKAVHSILCGYVNPGVTKQLNIDVLSERVYANYDDDISDSTRRFRRKKIKAAVEEIMEKLSDKWSISQSGKGGRLMYEISHKKS